MLYYKIPVIDGVFDYPAGCVLCCAYPVDSFMYCKFEIVTSVGSGWVEITESEFNVLCPTFPAPSLCGMILTEGVDYGTELPETGVKGQLFFLKKQ